MRLKNNLLMLRDFLIKNNNMEKETLDMDDKICDIVTVKDDFKGLGTGEVVKEYNLAINSFVEGVLEKSVLNFFPKSGEWYSNCFKKSNDINMNNLPCHLRDSRWLALMFRENQKLFMFTPSYLQEYIEKSDFFNEARHNYELEIVKWQINYMALGGEGWIIDESLGGDFFLFSPTADIAFRKGIVDTLTRIGMDEDVIEEGIEKYAASWRDCYMERAFSNEFDSVFLTFDFSIYGEKKEYTTMNKPILADVDPTFKKAWMDLRRYEYYQRHKISVDKYGVVLPEMMLSDEEVNELRGFVNEKAQERREEIERYEKQKKVFNDKKYMKKL